MKTGILLITALTVIATFPTVNARQCYVRNYVDKANTGKVKCSGPEKRCYEKRDYDADGELLKERGCFEDKSECDSKNEHNCCCHCNLCNNDDQNICYPWTVDDCENDDDGDDEAVKGGDNDDSVLKCYEQKPTETESKLVTCQDPKPHIYCLKASGIDTNGKHFTQKNCAPKETCDRKMKNVTISCCQTNGCNGDKPLSGTMVAKGGVTIITVSLIIISFKNLPLVA